MQEKLETEKNGWENKTIAHQEKVKEFLRSYFIKLLEKKAERYDMSSLELSGGNTDIMDKIKQGKILPEEVRALYNQNKVTQIQAVFVPEQGQNLDVYLTGEALEDYLKFYDNEN